MKKNLVLRNFLPECSSSDGYSLCSEQVAREINNKFATLTDIRFHDIILSNRSSCSLVLLGPSNFTFFLTSYGQ